MAADIAKVDDAVADLTKKLSELTDLPSDSAAKLFISDYLKRHSDDKKAIDDLNKALIACCSKLDKYERVYELRRYTLSSLCFAGDVAAIAELGWLYAGFDGDEMRLFKIAQRDSTVALVLLETAAAKGSFRACVDIAHMCSADRDDHFSSEYPRENIDKVLKKYLVKAFELYNKPINNPNYIEEIGFLFKYVPSKIVIEIMAANPDFAKYFPVYPEV